MRQRTSTLVRTGRYKVGTRSNKRTGIKEYSFRLLVHDDIRNEGLINLLSRTALREPTMSMHPWMYRTLDEVNGMILVAKLSGYLK